MVYIHVYVYTHNDHGKEPHAGFFLHSFKGQWTGKRNGSVVVWSAYFRALEQWLCPFRTLTDMYRQSQSWSVKTLSTPSTAGPRRNEERQGLGFEKS